MFTIGGRGNQRTLRKEFPEGRVCRQKYYPSMEGEIGTCIFWNQTFHFYSLNDAISCSGQQY